MTIIILPIAKLRKIKQFFRYKIKTNYGLAKSPKMFIHELEIHTIKGSSFSKRLLLLTLKNLMFQFCNKHSAQDRKFLLKLKFWSIFVKLQAKSVHENQILVEIFRPG